MVKINELIINNISTDSFPFPIYVETNDGFRMPVKKNKLFETEYTTGAIKDNIQAWSPIPKEYNLYCPTATLKDLRKLKLWAKDYGKLIASDEPDVYYEILDVSMDHSIIDNISGYRINIVFTCQPFGFEMNQLTKTYRTGGKITNHTNAPMYPLITVFGTSNVQTSVKIGNQTVYISKLIDKLTIENKYLEQDVRDRNNAQANNVMRGDFFEIPADSVNTITLGAGIDRIEILERWGWL